MNERNSPMSRLGNTLGAHMHLFRLLDAEPRHTQRQLSGKLCQSLVKTHYLLHALLDKGLLKAGNF